MKISTRGRYGTRAMLDLALHCADGSILVKDMARRQAVSERYLEQILISLKVAGLVRSARGSRGGFCLARLPSEITLGEVVRALEGSVAPVACVESPEAFARAPFCATHDVWVEIGRAINKVLDSMTLQDLADRQLRKESLTRGGVAGQLPVCGERNGGNGV